MAARFADNLARLRALVGAGLPLPPDLAAWTVAQVEANASADFVRRRRDQHLRAAAAMVSGSLYAKAQAIRAEANVLDRCWPLYCERQPDLGTFRGEIHAARLIAKIPQHRQLLTVLAETGGGPGERLAA